MNSNICDHRIFLAHDPPTHTQSDLGTGLVYQYTWQLTGVSSGFRLHGTEIRITRAIFQAFRFII